MPRDSLPKFAIVMLAVLLLGSAVGLVRLQMGAGVTETTGLVRGWDFQQFYISGRMIIDGRADELYDVEAFQAVQRSLLPVDEQNIPYLPLYPPTTALLAAPLAWLPYPHALVGWWLLNLAGAGAAGWLLLRTVNLGASWRWAIALGFAGFYPLLVALRAGQLSPILLLAVVVGLHLLRKNDRLSGSLVLSLLCLKPQFAVGMMLWMLLRGRWKVCLGMLAGGVLQAALAAWLLGPRVLANYVAFASIYWRHSQFYTFPPGWTHSIAGNVQRLLLPLGMADARAALLGKAVHGAMLILAAVAALVALSRARKRRGDNREATETWRIDHALAVLFTMLLTPHLLTYDLLLLAAPIVYLLPTARWRAALAMFAATSVLATPFYAWGDLSLVPLVLLTVFVALTRNATVDAASHARRFRLTENSQSGNSQSGNSQKNLSSRA